MWRIKKLAIRSKICFRCGGTGTFTSGETCYYCQGTGTID